MAENIFVGGITFIADETSIERTPGRTIDWDNVNNSFKGEDGVKRLKAGQAVENGSDGLVDANDSGQDATELLVEDVAENDMTSALTGVGTAVGGVIYEDLLPDTNPANLKTKLDAAGCHFTYVTYSDNTVSVTNTDSGFDADSGSDVGGDSGISSGT